MSAKEIIDSCKSMQMALNDMKILFMFMVESPSFVLGRSPLGIFAFGALPEALGWARYGPTRLHQKLGPRDVTGHAIPPSHRTRNDGSPEWACVLHWDNGQDSDLEPYTRNSA